MLYTQYFYSSQHMYCLHISRTKPTHIIIRVVPASCVAIATRRFHRQPMASADPVDVSRDWEAGLVPHIRPERPNPVREWPRVPAGPDRLQSLMDMWMSGLPHENQMALKAFLFPGASPSIFAIVSNWLSPLLYFILYEILNIYSSFSILFWMLWFSEAWVQI